MAEQTPNVVPEHRLTVPEVLGMLVSDGLIDKADADALIAEVRSADFWLQPSIDKLENARPQYAGRWRTTGAARLG